MAKGRKREPTPPAAAGVDGPSESETEEPELEQLEPDSAELAGEPVDAAGELPESGGDDEDVPASRALAPVGRSLARADPLTQYMNEIRRYPLLTREQEHELAVRYAQTGDVEAAKTLITANLRLVVKIAHEYRRAHKNLLDLVQEGNVGLMQAVRKYDPYRGVKLSSYAAWWIRAYILKFILNNWRLVKIGTTQAQRKLFFNLRKEKEKLEQLGFKPEPKLLAERLNVTENEVNEMERRLGSGELSLDAPLSRDEEGGATHLDMLESAGETRPDVAAEGDEFRALLRRKLQEFEKTLHGREQTIFHERLHAPNDATPLTLQEIGERYGISRERARQLEKRLTGKLRDYLRRELGDAVEIAMGLEE
jgi:RNA polymerase sigma-32 factor